ncbi:hypothetical protein GF312_14235 [Candidatus Poribacteria bacterium]|nr:hypothetical protein [Candidatus Poribacteria bacterium]
MRFSHLILASLICLLSTIGIHAAVVDGVVLHLPFDEGSGTVTQDMSGNGNDATLVGNPQWVDGKFGMALQFNGEENSNYVEVPDSPSLNPELEITCAAWIYFDEFHPSAGIISKYIGSGNQRSYNIHMNHTEDSLAIASGCSSNGIYQAGVSTTVTNTEEGTLTAGEWQHVAMTFRASEFLRIYINGELKADEDASATESIFDNEVPLLIGTDFEIGGEHNGQPREFTGIIDEVMVFNRALSDEEIGEIMEGTSTAALDATGKLTTTWASMKEE